MELVKCPHLLVRIARLAQNPVQLVNPVSIFLLQLFVCIIPAKLPPLSAFFVSSPWVRRLDETVGTADAAPCAIDSDLNLG